LRILAWGKPHEEQIFFCLWKVMRPHRRQPVCVLVWRLPKLEVPFVCCFSGEGKEGKGVVLGEHKGVLITMTTHASLVFKRRTDVPW